MGAGGTQAHGQGQKRLPVDLPLRLRAPRKRGGVYWLILPTVNTEVFSMALREFAKEVGVGEDKHIVLVVDRAG